MSIGQKKRKSNKNLKKVIDNLREAKEELEWVCMEHWEEEVGWKRLFELLNNKKMEELISLSEDSEEERYTWLEKIGIVITQLQNFQTELGEDYYFRKIYQQLQELVKIKKCF